jgi:hypothetical protein
MALRLFGDGRIEEVSELEIEANTSTDTPLTLIGATGQTANLLEVKDDTDTIIAKIEPDGDLEAVGGTFTGTIVAPAATTSLAPIRIPHGSAPSSPSNGDVWTTNGGLFARINGATQQYALLSVTLNPKTDNYTLDINDAGVLITIDASTAKTIEIPTNATAPFSTGTIIGIASLGTGEITIEGASGVTIRSVKGTTPKLSEQYAGAQCYKINTDEWLVIGGLS